MALTKAEPWSSQLNRHTDVANANPTISGHGVIGGGEQMLLRMAEAMRTLDQKVLVVGPSWGDLGAAVQRRTWRIGSSEVPIARPTPLNLAAIF